MKKNLENLDQAGIDEAIDYLTRKRAQLVGSETSEKMLGPNPFVGISRRGVLDTARMAAIQSIKNPSNLIKHWFGFAKEVTRVVGGKSDLAPPAKDRRFADVPGRTALFIAPGCSFTWLREKRYKGGSRTKRSMAMTRSGLSFSAPWWWTAWLLPIVSSIRRL